MADRGDLGLMGAKSPIEQTSDDGELDRGVSVPPPVGDLLNLIAIKMAEVADLSSLFDLFGREFGQLGLGVALVLPFPVGFYMGKDAGFPASTPLGGGAGGGAGGRTDGEIAVLTHYLSDPAPAPAEMEGALPPDSMPAGEPVNDLRHVREPLFLPRFAPVAGRLLPQATVYAPNAGLLIPLSRRVDFAGLLVVWGEISPDDIPHFSTFAGMLSLCLRSLRQTERQLHRYRSEQEILVELSQILLQGLDIPAVLGQVAEIIHRMDDMNASTVYLYDPRTAEVIPVGVAGWDGGRPLPIVDAAADGVYVNGVSYVYHKRVPVIIDDEETESRFGTPSVVTERGIRSVIIVPMLSGNQEVIGLIASSARKSYSMDEERVRLLSLIANHTAQAIDRLRLFEDTQRQLNELSVMHQASRLSTEIQDEDALIAAITELIGSILYPDNFGFVFLDEESGELVAHRSYRAGHLHTPDFHEVLPLDASACGKVYQLGIPIRVGDVVQDPRCEDASGAMRSKLCVPLVVGDKVLGVINAEDRRLHRFTEDDEHLLVTLANQIAMAIQRIRFAEVERLRRQRAENLRLATSTLAYTLDLDDVLANILEQLKTLLSFDSACVFLHNEWGLLAVAAIGFDNVDEIVGHYFTAKQSLYQEIRRTGRPLILADTWEDARFAGWAKTSHIRGWLGVPMMVREQIVGYITIDSHRPNTFRKEDADLALPFAKQAAMVIENARLFEAERRQHLVAQMQQEAAALLTSQTGVEQMLDKILGHLKQVIPYDSASIMLLGDDGKMTLSAHRDLLLSPEITQNFAMVEVEQILAKCQGADVTIIGDTFNDSRWVQIEGSPIRSWIGAILSIQNQPIGLLNIDSYETFSFDQSTAATVRAFANQAALAIHNARMFEQTQQALSRTQALYDSIQLLMAAPDLQSVLKVVAEQSRAILRGNRATLILFDSDIGQVLYRSTSTDGEITLDVLVNHQAGDLFDLLWTGKDGACLQSLTAQLSTEDPAGSSIRMPLIGQGEPFGLLSVWRGTDQAAFTGADVDVLGVISHQATSAIQNKRLFVSLGAEKERLDVLYSLSRNLTASLELSTVLERVLDEMIRHLGGYRGFVLLTNPDSDRLGLVAVSDMDADQVAALDEQIKLRIGQGLAGMAAYTGQPIVVSDVRSHDDWRTHVGLDEEARSAVAIPLFVGFTLIGVINLTSATQGFFDHQDPSLYNAISVPIALAIQNAQYYAGVQRRADELRVVSDVLRSLNMATELTDANLDLVEGLQSLTGCQDVFFYELDSRADCLRQMDLLLQAAPAMERAGQGEEAATPITIPLSELQGSFGVEWTEGALADAVSLNGETVYSPDLSSVLSPSSYEQNLLNAGINAQLIVPLRVSRRIVGAIQLGWDQAHGFHQQQLPVVIQICDAVAVLMEKSRLLNETNRRATELGAMYEFSAALRLVNRSEEVLTTSLDLVARYLQAQRGVVVVPDPNRSQMVIAHSFGNTTDILPPAFSIDHSMFGHVYQSGQAQFYMTSDLISMAPDHPAAIRSSLLLWKQVHDQATSLMVVPIRTASQTIGVLGLSTDGSRSPFADPDLRLLVAMAEIIGGALERAEVLETLEQRVVERTRELAEANEQLKQLDRLKSEFVANVSHELRTPLTNVKLYLHLLARKKADGQDAYLDVLNAEANHLQNLIETILDLSHLDAGTSGGLADFHLLDFGPIVATAVKNYQNQAKEKAIVLDLELPDEPVQIRGNRDLLLQMLDQLIANALNYSERDKWVHVKLVRRKDKVQLSVADQGMGISPEDRAHIFERFFRSTRATDANISGAGLGLSVVKEIVDRHQAQIRVQSEIGRGSTFIVDFSPIQEAV